MPELTASLVDVYPLSWTQGEGKAPRILLLRRSPGGRSPGSWEAVHGHIETGETSVAAALREVKEEIGCTPTRLYNLSRVEFFQTYHPHAIEIIAGFIAVLDPASRIALSHEHEAFEWLDVSEASRRVSWPRCARYLEDIQFLLEPDRREVLENTLRII